VKCNSFEDEKNYNNIIYFKILNMKKILSVLFLALLALLVACAKEVKHSSSLSCHFDQPAGIWEETFPLGNGRIGMMPNGGIHKETLVLNDISMWSGSKQDTDNPDALKYLPEIRKLLFEGKNVEAQELVYKTFVCKGKGSGYGGGYGGGYGVPYGSYQLFGNVVIDYSYPDTSTVSDYRRELHIDNAIAKMNFKKGNVTYSRETFTSFSSDLAIVRLTADKSKSLNFTVSMNRNAEREYRFVPEIKVSDKDLVFSGQLSSGTEEAASTQGLGMKYKSKLRILLPKGGELQTGDSNLKIVNATEAIFLIGITTDYFEKDMDKFIDSLFVAAKNQSYETMKKKHVAEYKELFDRVKMDLGHNLEKESLPMDKRLEAFANDDSDPSLSALYYQFGRYLLISSTRPGLLPPNLQGLWSKTIATPWNGDYHLNINLQMNLWGAETGNLHELLLPLAEWTKSQVESGRSTAKSFYGARGWVTHILGNVWEYTAPGEHPSWGATNTSAAWICNQLYDHFRFTQDTAYLKDIYPVMKEAALFFTDMLVEDPRSGHLVTAPTTSPENAYILPDGRGVYVCAGSTMDNQILRELFTNIEIAASILRIDKLFADALSDIESKLKPTMAGEEGRVMEWLEDYKEADPRHRHTSHLYGLHPGNDPFFTTEDGKNAARKTLIARGDESTGWSMAWKVLFWSRLQDGEHAYKLLRNLLKPAITADKRHRGGTYPNLFGAHPPFQIDGNFGGSAGIAEMLLQSTYTTPDRPVNVSLLPALPKAWKTGSFEGLRTRGGGVVSAKWEDGVLQYASVTFPDNRSAVFEIPAVAASEYSVFINGTFTYKTDVSAIELLEIKKGDVIELKKTKQK
jgi:alpha-L-fucosidase 2